jgi:hypothetical protein
VSCEGEESRDPVIRENKIILLLFLSLFPLSQNTVTGKKVLEEHPRE